jgi:hypothetical protein
MILRLVADVFLGDSSIFADRAGTTRQREGIKQVPFSDMVIGLFWFAPFAGCLGHHYCLALGSDRYYILSGSA